MDEDKHAVTEAAELSMGVKAWEEDVYGVGKFLKGKRKARGWTAQRERRFWSEVVGSRKSCDNSVRSFLEWLRDHSEDGSTYPGALPWS